MADPHIEPHSSRDYNALKASQSLLEMYSMPAISEIPLSTKSHHINGEEYGYRINFFVEPTPMGEKLVWASVDAPDPSSEAPCLLTLTPFPQGKAAEKILALLQRARDSQSKAEDILPELEMLGKEVNGIGWRPALSLPLQKRVELPPMSYISPPLEEVLKKDPLSERTFASTRNTNGKYEVCITTVHLREEGLSFAFYSSKDDEELKLIRLIEAPLHPAMRSDMETSGKSVPQGLMEFAAYFQKLFYSGGAETAIGYAERLNIPFNDVKSLPPGATTDDRLRLMQTITGPFEFCAIFRSAAFLAVETGDEVVSVMLESALHSEASTYFAILDRAKLNLSNDDWEVRRSEFIEAARSLGSDSEGAQLNALASLSKLATQQASNPTKVTNFLDDESTMLVESLVAKHHLLIHSEVGYSPYQIRRLCDGTDVIAISRAVSCLGSENLSVYNEGTFEFMVNGDLEFNARNLLGNQISGRVSAEVAERAGGRQKVFQFLAKHFGMQFNDMNRILFEDAVHTLVSIDPTKSFYLSTGQADYLDLPEPNDTREIRAFAVAERCARMVCEYGGGHGKHHGGVVAPGTAEARLQFPAAPYDLVLRFEDASIIRAQFIPRTDADCTVNRRYSFVGQHALTGGRGRDLELALIDFAEWGRDHSYKKEGAPPLEQTVAFRALKRLLPGEAHMH